MKKLLFLLPLLMLTGCELTKHQYHVEYVDGVTFDFKADACGLYKNGQLLACNSDGEWMFSVRWDQVKHFRDLTQDSIDQQNRERQERINNARRNNNNHDDGGSILGPIIVLHLLGII